MLAPLLSREPSNLPKALVVSLFDGLGSLWLALRDLPARMPYCWSCEVDSYCLAVLHHRFRHLKHWGSVLELTDQNIRDHFPADVEMVLVAGGSPCKQLSQLGSWRDGLAGRDSSLFWELARIWHCMRKLCESLRIPCFLLSEQVVPADECNVDQITQELQVGKPLLLDAAHLGWTHRKRLYWTNWPLPAQLAQWLTVLPRWVEIKVPHGYRNLPPLGSIFKGAYYPTMLRRAASGDFPEGRFPSISCRLAAGTKPHGRWCTKEAEDRAKFDGGHWPLWWYEAAALVWHDNEWRLIDADEAERLLGIPPGHTSLPQRVQDEHKVRTHEKQRFALLGNAWHIPSVRLLLLSLFLSLRLPVDAC